MNFFLVTMWKIQVNIFMIMLIHSSQRIFNPMRYTLHIFTSGTPPRFFPHLRHCGQFLPTLPRPHPVGYKGQPCPSTRHSPCCSLCVQCVCVCACVPKSETWSSLSWVFLFFFLLGYTHIYWQKICICIKITFVFINVTFYHKCHRLEKNEAIKRTAVWETGRH